MCLCVCVCMCLCVCVFVLCVYAGMAKCGPAGRVRPQRVFNVLQLCVAYIAVAHYKIRLIKKWPSRTELLAIPALCVCVCVCVCVCACECECVCVYDSL